MTDDAQQIPDARTPLAPPRRGLRVAAWVVLVAAGGGALGLLLWPSGGQVRELHIAVWVWLWRLIGAPDWFTPEVSEQFANSLILFVPMAALTVLAWRVRWWWLAIGGALIGVCVEFAQWAVMSERVVDPVDAFWNAVGALAGVAAGVWLRR